MTASTSGCPTMSSITSGIVSRVSPPARSTGLLRLQRGGSLRVDRGPQVVGQRRRARGCVRAMRVGGDHAPAAGGGEHDDAVPLGQRLGGERGGRLERLLDGGRPRDAGLAAHAVEDPVVAGQRAGVRGGGPLPACGRAALHEHERLAGGDGAGALEEGAPVGDALDVGERHLGGRRRRRRSRGSRGS